MYASFQPEWPQFPWWCFRGTLEAYVSVTNIVTFRRCLVHEVLLVGYFTILNIINLVSDPLFPGIKLTDARVGGGDVMNSLFWRNNECAGGSKNKKLVQLGIDVRYMVILIL